MVPPVSVEEFLREFDPSQLDPAALSDEIPQLLAKRVALAAKGKVQEVDEETRFRLIANGLVAARLRGEIPPWIAELDDLIMGYGRFAAKVRTTESGLSLLRADSWGFVVLPNAKDEMQVLEILNTLNELEMEHRGISSWVFDLSGIEVASTALIAFLVGFKQGAGAFHRNVSLLWMRPDSIPAGLLSSVTKQFNLFQKGAFLLSRS